MRRRWSELAPPTIALAAYLALASYPPVWSSAFGALFPDESRVLYENDSMLRMIGTHIGMVALSTTVAALIGVALGVFVTRPAGEDFFGLVSDLGNLGQTFPPVAVLALAVPAVGLGFKPTVLALTLYAVLPILSNTIAGLNGVPDAVVASARAMGMRPSQRLWHVELPVATPIIFAGVRVAAMVGVATATLGATIDGGGLGAPIISGLQNFDPAVTLQGGLLAAGLAFILDAYLAAVERLLTRRVRPSSTDAAHDGGAAVFG